MALGKKREREGLSDEERAELWMNIAVTSYLGGFLSMGLAALKPMVWWMAIIGALWSLVGLFAHKRARALGGG
jgi:hypothetical protein